MVKSVWTVLLSIILFSGAGCASLADKPSITAAVSHPSTITIPRLETGNALLVVEASIEGQTPRPFVVDTGATVSGLIAHQEDAERDRSDVIIHGMAEVAGFPTRSIASLKIGQWDTGPRSLVVLPPRRQLSLEGRPVDGIIGLDILKERVLHYNQNRDIVSFILPAHFGPDLVDGWHRIELQDNPYAPDERQLRFVTLSFSGELIPALLDLGSSNSFMTWNGGDVTAIKAARKRIYEAWRMQGSVGEFGAESLFMLKGLDVGTKRFASEVVLVSDLDGLKVLGFGENPFFIAGASLWTRQSFVIDFKNKVMYLKKTPPKRQSLTRGSSGISLQGGGRIEID